MNRTEWELLFFVVVFGGEDSKKQKTERSLQRLVKKVPLLEAGFRILPPQDTNCACLWMCNWWVKSDGQRRLRVFGAKQNFDVEASYCIVFLQ
jgi:hypothetical protein